MPPAPVSDAALAASDEQTNAAAASKHVFVFIETPFLHAQPSAPQAGDKAVLLWLCDNHDPIFLTSHLAKPVCQKCKADKLSD